MKMFQPYRDFIQNPVDQAQQFPYKDSINKGALMCSLSDPTKAVMGLIHEADAALARGEIAKVKEIRDHLAAGDLMERVGAEIIDMTFNKKVKNAA